MNADEILSLHLEDKTQGTESYLPSGWHGKFELFVVYNECIKENTKEICLFALNFEDFAW